MTPLIEYVPGESIFHRLDPRSKIIFTLLISSSVFLITQLWLAVLVLSVLIGLWFAAGLPFGRLKGLGKALISIFIFLLVAQSLFYPGHIILIQPIIPSFVPLIGGTGYVALEGVLFGLLLILRVLSMVIVLPLISLTTPINVLSLGLVRLGLSYKLAYTMTTALNLVPVLQSEASLIVDAQRLRAFQVFENGNFLQKLKAYPSLVTPLIIGAMRRAQLVAVAMDSRAFGASSNRTYIQDIHMQARDWVFVGLSTLATMLIVVSNFLFT